MPRCRGPCPAHLGPAGLALATLQRWLAVHIRAEPAAGLDVERLVDRLVPHTSSPEIRSQGDQPRALRRSVPGTSRRPSTSRSVDTDMGCEPASLRAAARDAAQRHEEPRSPGRARRAAVASDLAAHDRPVPTRARQQCIAASTPGGPRPRSARGHQTHSRTHVILLIQDLEARVINAIIGELLRELTIDHSKDCQPRK